MSRKPSGALISLANTSHLAVIQYSWGSSNMLVCVTVVLVLFSCTCGENPAIQVNLSNKGLQYGKHTGMDWIQMNLERVTLPDISGKVSMGFLGSIHYTLTGIHITKCDLPEPVVEFYPASTGFKASLPGLSVALTGEWMTKYGIIQGGGAFDMAIFSASVTSVAELGRDADGHLSITSVSCDAQIGEVDVQFHGGASWIIQRFVNYFKGRVHSELESGICPNLEESIANLEYHLQTMNVSLDVDQALALDLSLTGLPVIDVSNLNLGLKGEFYSTKTHTDPPFEARPFSMPEQLGYMLTLGLSEFTANSASYGYYSDGLLQVLINDSMIPQGCPLRLNTSLMGPFIPQLPQLFPDLPMKLLVYAREVPRFSFRHEAVTLGFQGTVKAFAVQKNSTETPLFKLNVDIQLSSKAWTAGGNVKGSVSMNNFTLALVDSEVGTFKTDALEKITRIAINMGLANLNAKLAKGFPLPRMKHAQLVNSVLLMGEGFIALSADAEVFLTDRGFK